MVGGHRASTDGDETGCDLSHADDRHLID